MVDDSHAVGFIGEKGRGSHELRGVLGQHRHPHRHARQGAGRRLGRLRGGVERSGRQLLRQRARPYLFSNSLMPAIAHATLRRLDLLEKGGDAARRAARTTPRTSAPR